MKHVMKRTLDFDIGEEPKQLLHSSDKRIQLYLICYKCTHRERAQHAHYKFIISQWSKEGKFPDQNLNETLCYNQRHQGEWYFLQNHQRQQNKTRAFYLNDGVGFCSPNFLEHGLQRVDLAFKG